MAALLYFHFIMNLRVNVTKKELIIVSRNSNRFECYEYDGKVA